MPLILKAVKNTKKYFEKRKENSRRSNPYN